MKITLSAIKADIGAIGGHTKPSDELIEAVKKVVKENSKLLLDYYHRLYRRRYPHYYDTYQRNR